jgi:hypothetical protein
MALETLDTESTNLPTSQATTPRIVGKALAGKNSAYGLPVTGAATGIEPGLLENMQKLINEREAQKNSMYSALQEASAWGSGGVQGPGAMLLQLQKQREEEDATTFGMKSQLSQARMAQKMAENDAAFVKGQLGGGGGGGGGFGTGTGTGTAGAQYSPEAIAAANAARTPTEARAILQEDLKSRGAARNKGMFEAAGNKPEKYWWPVIGDVDLTPNQLINLPPEIRQQIEEATLKRFGVLPAGAARTGAAPTGAAPTGAGGVNVANIEKVESGGNAAAVSPKGAQGVMQVMPNTQRDPGFGVRPAADNSPEELKRVGQDYYGAMQNRYGHDTLAAIAYNMGPGKTDEWLKAGADFNKLPAETQAYIGKVNLANAMQNRQVATAPATAVRPAPQLALPTAPDNFPVVAGEELQASQRFTPPAPITAPSPISAPAPAPAQAPMAAPAPTAPATAARSPTAPIEFNEPRPSSSDPKYKSRGQYEADVQTWERKRDAAIKIQEEFQKELVKGTAENIILDEKAFRATTEPKSVAERKTSAERVVQLVNENPKAVGILAAPGITNALATIVRDGLNTPSGAVGVKTIEEALAKTMPGTSQKIINARNEIAQNLARGALEASKLSQGQGSVSDFERTMFEKIAGSLADTPELLIKRQQMLISRATLDQQLGRMYRASRTGGGVTDYEKFMSRPDVEKLIDNYEEDLRKILGSSASAPTAGTTPGGIKFKVITPGKTQ